MLVFDPKKRITATEALTTEYVSPYHDSTDEPEAADKFDWSFNDADLPLDTWKVMMYSEILGVYSRSHRFYFRLTLPSDFHQADAEAVANLEGALAPASEALPTEITATPAT